MSEKAMATQSSTLAWKLPGTGEPDRLQSMGSHGVGHDWSDLAAAAAIYVLIREYCFSMRPKQLHNFCFWKPLQKSSSGIFQIPFSLVQETTHGQVSVRYRRLTVLLLRRFRVQKTVLYICVSFAVSHTGLSHWNMYNIIYETNRQSRFDAWNWMLGAGALGWLRGMVRGRRREGGSGWGTRVYLWRIHVDVWQNQYNIVK